MGRYSSTELMVQKAIPQLQIRSFSERDLARRPCEPSCRITPNAFILSPISRTNTIPTGIDQARGSRGRRLAAVKRIATSTQSTPIAVKVSRNDCSESD